MNHDVWMCSYHITPPSGWLNDPNGLCQFKGLYHAFFQYSPNWPKDDTRLWGHMVSHDLLHWTDAGVALKPTLPEDRDGVYSGCAYITPQGEMNLYYTGNVIHAGGYDYVHEGREANEILVTSTDGMHFSEKHVLLRNNDYPVDCTQHVRDPKVWNERGSMWMVLGARDQRDHGQALIYRSDDGINWKHHHAVRSKDAFGYMWECPNIIQIEGQDFLAVCPQGLQSEELRYHNRWQAGYFPLECALIDAHLVNQHSFVEWDYGWDFYAPQVFVDKDGRTILIGWMGTFDREWTAVPENLSWCHCLTLPRELSVGADGLLHQTPVREFNSCHKEQFKLEGILTIDDPKADIQLNGIQQAGSIMLDDALEFELTDTTLTVRFFDDLFGAGRTRRTVTLKALPHSARIIVDGSTVELYLDEGTTVFSTRWFPQSATCTIASQIPAAQASVWTLQ